MRLALVQMSASTKNLALNQEKILRFIRQGIDQGIELICFPEMALIGYDFDHMEDRLRQQGKMLEAIQALAIEAGITVMVGGIEAEGNDLYIAQFVLNNTIDTYRKIHVGGKEGQYVKAGETIKVFHVQGHTIGLMLCYDGHFPDLVTIMKGQGAQIVLNPSASPNQADKRVAMWSKYLKARAYDNRVWLGAVNLRFKGKGGGTLVINSNGEDLASSTLNEDLMTLVDYESMTYNPSTMKARDFTLDRREEVYEKYR